jgi:hypothetical protein
MRGRWLHFTRSYSIHVDGQKVGTLRPVRELSVVNAGRILTPYRRLKIDPLLVG